MKVLGLETSCDETGLAIYDSTMNGRGGVLSQVLYSQINLHATYGGVVPELASRDHIRKLVPLFNELLDQANITKSDIDAVAYTKGPGLIGALMTGGIIWADAGVWAGRASGWGASYGGASVSTAISQ